MKIGDKVKFDLDDCCLHVWGEGIITDIQLKDETWEDEAGEVEYIKVGEVWIDPSGQFDIESIEVVEEAP